VKGRRLNDLGEMMACLQSRCSPLADLHGLLHPASIRDLANRSKHGQLREAKTSGHYIQRDQPELGYPIDQTCH
jgi:hypothetical protein